MGEHYLVLAELMAHKRIDVAVRAFNQLGRRLVVVGDGPEARRLKRLAGPTISFTGRVSDQRVAELLSSARALVVTAAEEFGIAAVESLASGRPVIALDAGGVRESVREGETGTYYEGATIPTRSPPRSRRSIRFPWIRWPASMPPSASARRASRPPCGRSSPRRWRPSARRAPAIAPRSSPVCCPVAPCDAPPPADGRFTSARAPGGCKPSLPC